MLDLKILLPTHVLVDTKAAKVTAEGAHAGRWRRDFDESTCAAIDEVYAESCGRLVNLGIAIPASGD